MNIRTRLLWSLAALTVGCGDSTSPPAEGHVDAGGHEPKDGGADPEMDAGMDSGSGLDGDDAGSEDAGTDAGQQPVFGLDTRPANTTCLAPNFGEEMAPVLSQTGCFDTETPGEPLPMLIPFDLNAALWSDEADKHRWMVLPDGAQITVGEGGDFFFPPGTMLIKEFRMGERKLETRFMVHHPVAEGADAGASAVATTWVGYAYQWDVDQTEATLVPATETEPFDIDGPGGQDDMWEIPNRVECMTCHNAAPNFALGPEIGQLNRDFTYPATGRTANQLATLEHIGMFDQPLAGAPNTLLHFPPYASGEATVEQKARSYLHVNCSHCHREGSTKDGVATDDFRATIPLSEMGICGQNPSNNQAVLALVGDADGGVPDGGVPALLSPGAPELSLLWLRMGHRGSYQMPPIATKQVDELGKNLLKTWINTITECP